jgi:hypothetical protein
MCRAFALKANDPGAEVTVEVLKYDFKTMYRRSNPSFKNVKELCRDFLLSPEFRMGLQTLFGMTTGR